MPAFRQPVVMDELGVRPTGPTARRGVDLVRECAHRYRYRDPFWGKERQLAFPVEPSRRDPRAREPVERYVVKNVVSRQAFAPAGKYACDQPITARVVIEHPGGQADW